MSFGRHEKLATIHILRQFSTTRHLRKDLYKILQVQPNADKKEIKSQYYKLSKQYHPDLNPSEESHALFLEIGQAYQVLSDERKRKEYDQQHSRVSQTSTRIYRRQREKMKPDDWVLYRTRNPQKKHFDYERHAEEHYGVYEEREQKRTHRAVKSEYYRTKYNEHAAAVRTGRWVMLGALTIFVFASGWIDMIRL
ncbi:DnaJ domain-containing protein [Gorgonomyces haynaldii]|nr:DnaJ domain-containing protein [Gorgonomyces haynaldii]